MERVNAQEEQATLYVASSEDRLKLNDLQQRFVAATLGDVRKWLVGENPQQKERTRVACAMGPAGSGKTTMCLVLAQHLKELARDGFTFRWTATVGSTAFEHGGTTLHSFLGLGLAEFETVEQLRDTVIKSGKKEIWTTGKKYCIVVDEFHRVGAQKYNLLFNLADNCEVQIYFIFIGDIYQISEEGEERNTAELVEGAKGPCVELEKRHRFSSDLGDLLEKAARSKLNEEDIEKMNTQFGKELDQTKAMTIVKSRAMRKNYWANMADKVPEALLVTVGGVGDGEWKDGGSTCGRLLRDLYLAPDWKYVLRQNEHQIGVGNGTLIDTITRVAPDKLRARVGEKSFLVQRVQCPCGEHWQFPIHPHGASTLASAVGLQFEHLVVDILEMNPREACNAIARAKTHLKLQIKNLRHPKQLNFQQHKLKLESLPELELLDPLPELEESELGEPQEEVPMNFLLDIGLKDPVARRKVDFFLVRSLHKVAEQLRKHEVVSFEAIERLWDRIMKLNDDQFAAKAAREAHGVCLYHDQVDAN